MKRVTVYDVAKELGISTSTVSRVLNKSILIGKEKQELILETARRLGYEKRPIRKQQHRAILNIKLFLPTHRFVSAHLFYNAAELISGLYEGFGDVKVNLITQLSGFEDDLFQTKKLGDIDGCVFAFSAPNDEISAKLKDRNIPAVELNRINPARNYVSCDNSAGMEALMASVLRRRAAPVKPCFIGFAQIPPINEQRKQGFFAAAEKLRVEAEEEDAFLLHALSDISREFLRKILKRGYNAVHCFNDVLAVYFYQAAVQEGLSIPGDLSLTGFDNSPVLDLVSKRIDTVNLSVPLLGREAGRWLKGRIIDREEKELQKLIPGDYVPGETVG